MKVTAIYLNSYLDGTGRLPELLIPCLTTPISYTFEKNDPTQDKDRSNRMFGAMAAQLAYAQNGDTYILVDPGPNQIMDIREPREFLKQYNDHMRGLRDGEGICKLLYDPTNGSVSGGDLVWKSGRGCINGRQLAPQGAQDGSGTKPPSLERGDQRP
ncbi:hypothetical protein HYR69_00815 [Candidatus Sumerlaeota bacterium]|nr:hypothetical protein [Candidatus Sumerlaeota bacterium]MBI3735489.1 hypothetical protein [Candidatus Sumerlaeota bacterium]